MAAPQRLAARLAAPRDAAGLAAFRVLFGALMLAATLRFWAKGWVDTLYVEPAFHFTWAGFDWVRPWPGAWMEVHFALMALAALSLTLGYRTRVSAGAFWLFFTYAELIDKATYLNHYYLVSLLALLLAVLPSGAAYSLDARRRGGPRPVPLGAYALLRAQVAVVYVFAGLAKLDADWLLRAEPLHTWLQAHAHLPLLGPLLATPAAALAMSWAGALYDLTIAGFLLWRPSRPFAFAAAALFHVGIWLLFPVGMFSWVMLVCTTVFFDPDWPRRWFGAPEPPGASSQASPPRLPSLAIPLASAWLLIQLALPLRHLAYPGAVNWTEEGFRFAWRVMLTEKTGQAEFELRTADSPSPRLIFPQRDLTPLQAKMMSTQPDMIHDYAHFLAARARAEGQQDVRVYAHVTAALNGRPSQPLIDPRVDLAAQPRTLLGASPWILPLRQPQPSE
ncbi:MAG: HTTM domain-containing protein [Myxococcota bacterium]